MISRKSDNKSFEKSAPNEKKWLQEISRHFLNGIFFFMIILLISIRKALSNYEMWFWDFERIPDQKATTLSIISFLYCKFGFFTPN